MGKKGSCKQGMTPFSNARMKKMGIWDFERCQRVWRITFWKSLCCCCGTACCISRPLTHDVSYDSGNTDATNESKCLGFSTQRFLVNEMVARKTRVSRIGETRSFSSANMFSGFGLKASRVHEKTSKSLKSGRFPNGISSQLQRRRGQAYHQRPLFPSQTR